MRYEGADIEELERTQRIQQRPIMFGGVKLPHLTKHEPHPKPGPAGDETQTARTVAISRWALASRIKHGERLADLRSHFEVLVSAEEALLTE